MLNINATISQIDKLCRQMGQQFTVTRNGSTVGKSYGIVGKSESSDATDSGVSNLTVEQKVIYIPANPRWSPRPGDEFTATKVTYRVVSSEAYQPGKTAIAHKVTVE